MPNRSSTGSHGGQVQDALIACGLSTSMVGTLVGIVYWDTTYGALGGLGSLAMLVGMPLLILPGLAYWVLMTIGILPELRGRESFIRLNPALWLFCAVFYAFVFYAMLRRRRSRNATGTAHTPRPNRG